MPNVNALKKFAKKKVNKSNLASNVKANAKKNINRLRVKRGTEKFTAEQKLYNRLLKHSDELANNIVFTPITQRLLSVTPLPMSVKKALPKSSGREARRATVRSASMALRRTTGLPTNLLDKIMEPLIFRSVAQRQRR